MIISSLMLILVISLQFLQLRSVRRVYLLDRARRHGHLEVKHLRALCRSKPNWPHLHLFQVDVYAVGDCVSLFMLAGSDTEWGLCVYAPTFSARSCSALPRRLLGALASRVHSPPHHRQTPGRCLRHRLALRNWCQRGSVPMCGWILARHRWAVPVGGAGWWC